METVTCQEYWCRTTSGSSAKCSITWTIENFKNRKEEFGKGIQSSNISVTDSDNQVTEWCFVVYPRGRRDADGVECKDSVSVTLYSLNESPVTASWDGWILDEANQKRMERSSPALSLPHPQFGYTGLTAFRFFKASELTDSLLPNGNLTLVLDVTVHGEGKTVSGSKVSHNNNNNNNNTLHQRHEKLSNDLCQLLADKEFSDIEIHCDEKVFPSHQSILAARSPVFKAMIQNEMMEKQNKKIFIKDVKPRTVAEMLNFMYTGDISVDEMEEISCDLLRVADMYELDDLKEMCEEKLVCNLSVENSIESLVLGDSHNASKLKKMALDLVTKNMKKIVDTDVYKDLLAQRPALTLEITKVILQENE